MTLRKQFGLCCLILILTGNVSAADIADVNNMAQAGATELAVKAIDKYQPDYKLQPQIWIDWEKLRISILKQEARHKKIVTRLQNLPERLPVDVSAWAATELALAQMALGENKAARTSLRKIIWTLDIDAASDAAKDWLPQWRKMLIHSYLQDGLAADALIAITRYRQDYGEDEISGVVLYARILLINDQNDAARQLLAKYAKQPQAGMLFLLAQLRSKARSPRKVLQAALRQIQGEWAKDELATYLWAIIAESAAKSQDYVTQIKALENLLTDSNLAKLPDGLFDIHADVLWKAYHDYAMVMGNKAQFLVGADEQWLKAAREEKQKINARAFAAFILLRGQDEKVRLQAAEFIRKQLDKNNKKRKDKQLLSALFLDSDNFKDYAAIPLSIRYVLVENAIAKQDIPTASKIIATIRSAPKGADDFMWNLRRARVLVMGGHASEANLALVSLLQQNSKLEEQNFDRFIQVVFDLQTIGAHEESINLFTGLMSRSDDVQRQRELYYWIAESHKAQQRFADAAQAYLKSAMLTEADMMDPWAQTARYQAAKVLLDGKIYSDARTIYEHLLRVTEDASRRAVLERELQQLKIMQNQ